MWRNIKGAHHKVLADGKRMREDQSLDWRDKGAPEDQEPTMPNLPAASPNAYMIAHALRCSPNLLVAISNWLDAKATAQRLAARILLVGKRNLASLAR